jgi:hypothetical protein
VSLSVQRLPSLHAVPSLAVGFEQVPLVGSQVPTMWHWSDATHVTGLPPTQLPLWHVSVSVQAFASLHVAPFAATGFEQVPLVGSHVPATWHWSDAVHVTVLPATQLPAWQVSFFVQALPSLHVVPFAAAGFEHAPLVGSQVPTTWHWSDAVQVTGLPPTQLPPWHVSVNVQALPSLHVVPFEAVGFEHAPVDGLHVPATWHWSDAVQVTGVPTHVPL